MACGLACFLLHDLIEFALFMPGAATAFWVAAGACLAQAPAREAAQEADRPDLWRKTHLPKWGVVLGLVAVAAAVNFLWVPVFQRTVLTQEMVNACRRNPPPRSEDLASLAVRLIKVDELDPYAASEATRLLMNVSPRTAPEWAAIVADRDPASSNLRHLLADAGLNRAWPKAVQYAWMGLPADAAKEEGALREAMKFEPPNVAMLSRLAGLLMAQGKAQESIRTLEQAVKMEPDTPTLRVLLGDVLWRSAQWEKACEAWQRAADLTRDGDSEAYLTPMARAVELNPNDIRLRLAYAEMLLWADRPAYAQRELAQAEAINAQLLQSNPESIERLKPAEAEQVKILRARAECLAKRPRIN